MNLEGVKQKVASFLGFGGKGAEPESEDRVATESDRNEATPKIEDESDLASLVSDLHDQWLEERRAYEPGWYLDIAFYLGLQWHRWDSMRQTLNEPDAPSYRVRMVINKIMSTIRIILGKINRGQVRATVYPIQDGDRAFSDARMSSRVLRAQYTNLMLADPIKQFTLWLVTCGTSFLKIGFDESLGEMIDLPDGTRMPIGEVTCDVKSPFQILAPPGITGVTYPTRIIECGMIDIEMLRSRYGDVVNGIKPDESNVNETERRVTSLVSAITGQSGYTKGKSNSAYVLELWEDPEVLHPEDRDEYPNGRVTVMAYTTRRILSVHENPYRSWTPHLSKLPFVMGRDDMVPGRFWGSSRIDQLAPIQKSYNKARSQMIEARNLCVQPKINLVKGSGIEKITNEPGQQLERNPSMPAPEYMNPPQMPQHLIEDIRETREDYEEVSQMGPASRGIAPSANISGYGIDLLQEADNTPLQPLAQQLSIALSSMYTKILERSHQFYDEARTLSYVGESNEADVFVFLADRHITPLRVEVTAESVLPEGRAIRRAKISEAIKDGILDPVRHREKILRILEIGEFDYAWEEEDLDRQAQMRELRDMMRGQPVMVNPWDDNPCHISVINRLRKSAEWNSLDPEIQMIINQHADAHADAELMTIGNMPPPQMAGAPPPVGGDPMMAGPPGATPPAL